MSIGHHPEQGQFTPDMRKDEENITMEDRMEAKRRIGGSITSDFERESHPYLHHKNALPSM
jgi:phosphatidylserine decarboxylase